MKKVFLTIIMLAQTTNSYSSSLEGIWKEDKEKTISWNLANTRIEPEKLAKLASLIGHMYVIYKDGKACQFSEPHTLKYNEIVKDIPRLPAEHTEYEIVAENEFGYVLKTTYKDKTVTIDVLIYETEESRYVLRLSPETYGFEGARIYFKRVEPNKLASSCVS